MWSPSFAPVTWTIWAPKCFRQHGLSDSKSQLGQLHCIRQRTANLLNRGLTIEILEIEEQQVWNKIRDGIEYACPSFPVSSVSILSIGGCYSGNIDGQREGDNQVPQRCCRSTCNEEWPQLPRCVTYVGLCGYLPQKINLKGNMIIYQCIWGYTLLRNIEYTPNMSFQWDKYMIISPTNRNIPMSQSVRASQQLSVYTLFLVLPRWQHISVTSTAPVQPEVVPAVLAPAYSKENKS